MIPFHTPEFSTRGSIPRKCLKTFGETKWLINANLPELGTTKLSQIVTSYYKKTYEIKLSEPEISEYAYRLAKEAEIPVPEHQDVLHELGYTIHTLRSTGVEPYRKGKPWNNHFWLKVTPDDDDWKCRHVENKVMCHILAVVKIWKAPVGQPQVYAIIWGLILQKTLLGADVHGLTQWMYNATTPPWMMSLGSIYGGVHCVSNSILSEDTFFANAHIYVPTWNLL